MLFVFHSFFLPRNRITCTLMDTRVNAFTRSASASPHGGTNYNLRLYVKEKGRGAGRKLTSKEKEGAPGRKAGTLFVCS